jgi:cell division transport system permease protein
MIARRMIASRMIATLHLPRQFRLDLPLRQDASGRFLPWIIALMVYLAAMGGVGLIWLGDTLSQWDASLASALTLQVPADTSQPRIDMALGALRQTKGVVSADMLQPEDTAKLLQPWLGSSVAIANLPLPHLVDVRVDPRATIDYPTLRKQLDSIVPGAQLDNNRSWLGGVREFALRIEGVITAGVMVVTALIVAIIIFTARIGLAIHRSVIELLHLLGAQDDYIARQFQVHALSLGLRGGVIGGAAAALTVVILGPAGHMLELPVPIAAYGIFDWRLWLLLIVTGLAAGGVAMVTARITVLRQLARMP